MKYGLFIAGGIVVLILVVVFGLYSYTNSLRTQVISAENQMNAQYQDNQNYLSNYTSSFYEQIGVANLKSDKMDQILLDAVKGRYESSGGYSTNGSMFSAIVEAYPQLDLKLYDEILKFVQSQRVGYRERQTKLLDMIRAYDTFRQTGWIRSIIVSSLIGAPTQNLVARIGTGKKTGQDALDQMNLIVLTSDTKKAYETGTMEPLTVPGGKPSPAPSSAVQQTPVPQPKVKETPRKR